MEIPFIIAGNGGHGLTPLTRSGQPTLRVPVRLPSDPNVTFENYDDTDYGYLRVIVNTQQLRIEVSSSL
jgi:Iron/zinc purple acid phosphatase-like protein C